MQLFREVSARLSKENAKHVLEQYRTQARIAGEEYAPKITISYSLEPKASSGSVNKATENMVARRVDAQNLLEQIAKAINSLSEIEYIHILIEKYCRKQKRQDKQIYLELGYSESEFYRVLDRALYEFAEAYRHGELLVYKKVSKSGSKLQVNCKE